MIIRHQIPSTLSLTYRTHRDFHDHNHHYYYHSVMTTRDYFILVDSAFKASKEEKLHTSLSCVLSLI